MNSFGQGQHITAVAASRAQHVACTLTSIYQSGQVAQMSFSGQLVQEDDGTCYEQLLEREALESCVTSIWCGVVVRGGRCGTA